MEDLGEFYHLRAFTENVDLDKLVEFLKTETDVLVIVSEFSKIGHRPHIHATVKFRKAINTFRDKFRKEFPQLFGNKSYSIKAVRNYDSNIKYCLKGVANDYPDVLYTTLSDEEVKQYYNEYWELKDTILLSKKTVKTTEVNMGCQNDPSGNVIVVKPKTKSLSWSEKLTKTIIKEYPLLCKSLCEFKTSGTGDYEMIHETLVGILLQHLGRVSKNLDEFILMRLYNAQVNAIIQQCGDDACKRMYKKDIAQKIKFKVF